MRAIQMLRRRTRHKHHQTRDILGCTQPPIRTHLRNLLRPTTHLHQPTGHLTRVKARINSITHDAPGPQLHRQILGQMQHRGLGRRIAVGRLRA